MKGLTKEVKKMYEFPVNREELFTSSGLDSGWDVLYRPDTGEILSVVTRDNYKLITHKEAIEPLVESLDMVGGFALERIQINNNGSRIEIGFVNKEITYDVDGNGDEISPTFRVINSYDKQYGLTYLMGTYRLVCENGLRLFRDMERIREFHVGRVDPIRMTEQIEKNLEKFPQLAKNYRKMVKKTVRNQLLLAIINNRELSWKVKIAMFERMREEGYLDFDDDLKKVSSEKEISIKKQFTLWYLYNVFTRLMTHDRRVMKSGYRVECERKFSDFVWREAMKRERR